MDGLVIGSGSLVGPPNEYSEVLDCDLKFTSTGTTNGDDWYVDNGSAAEYYLDGDSAQSYDSLDDSNESCLQTIVESDSAETIKFYWKVSSEQDGDYLQFYIDETLKDQISGEVDWQSIRDPLRDRNPTASPQARTSSSGATSKTPARRQATIAAGWTSCNGAGLPPPRTPLTGSPWGIPYGRNHL